MVTREQLEISLDDETKKSFVTKNVDHGFIAIRLLRGLIPYRECYNIIKGAGHDALYLCDVDMALPYLSEEDLVVLADCNCWIDEDNDTISLYT